VAHGRGDNTRGATLGARHASAFLCATNPAGDRRVVRPPWRDGALQGRRAPPLTDGGWLMGAKHEALTSPSLFYVVVDFRGNDAGSQPTCYVLPSAVAARAGQGRARTAIGAAAGSCRTIVAAGAFRPIQGADPARWINTARLGNLIRKDAVPTLEAQRGRRHVLVG